MTRIPDLGEVAGVGPERCSGSIRRPFRLVRCVRLGSDFAEVGVVFVDPVLAGWGEDVEVDAVFLGSCGVGKVAGDDEDFAGVDGVRGAVVEVEAKSALGDEGDLFVGVGMARDDAAFGEDDAGEHGLIAGDELS